MTRTDVASLDFLIPVDVGSDTPYADIEITQGNGGDILVAVNGQAFPEGIDGYAVDGDHVVMMAGAKRGRRTGPWPVWVTNGLAQRSDVVVFVANRGQRNGGRFNLAGRRSA